MSVFFEHDHDAFARVEDVLRLHPVVRKGAPVGVEHLDDCVLPHEDRRRIRESERSLVEDHVVV